jgi:hypothetical protein
MATRSPWQRRARILAMILGACALLFWLILPVTWLPNADGGEENARQMEAAMLQPSTSHTSDKRIDDLSEHPESEQQQQQLASPLPSPDSIATTSSMNPTALLPPPAASPLSMRPWDIGPPALPPQVLDVERQFLKLNALMEKNADTHTPTIKAPTSSGYVTFAPTRRHLRHCCPLERLQQEPGAFAAVECPCFLHSGSAVPLLTHATPTSSVQHIASTRVVCVKGTVKSGSTWLATMVRETLAAACAAVRGCNITRVREDQDYATRITFNEETKRMPVTDANGIESEANPFLPPPPSLLIPGENICEKHGPFDLSGAVDHVLILRDPRDNALSAVLYYDRFYAFQNANHLFWREHEAVQEAKKKHLSNAHKLRERIRNRLAGNADALNDDAPHSLELTPASAPSFVIDAVLPAVESYAPTYLLYVPIFRRIVDASIGTLLIQLQREQLHHPRDELDDPGPAVRAGHMEAYPLQPLPGPPTAYVGAIYAQAALLTDTPPVKDTYVSPHAHAVLAPILVLSYETTLQRPSMAASALCAFLGFDQLVANSDIAESATHSRSPNSNDDASPTTAARALSACNAAVVSHVVATTSAIAMRARLKSENKGKNVRWQVRSATLNQYKNTFNTTVVAKADILSKDAQSTFAKYRYGD